jgi:DnaJ like chaperone protein
MIVGLGSRAAICYGFSMSYWGKMIGGVAGFAMGGPVGALFGAALGHAADSGALPNLAGRALPFESARVAAMLGRRDQLFAIGVTVIAAKLAKCDGPVTRAEIDAFRASFRIPDENVRVIGRMFDQARDSAEGFEPYARQLGEVFADNRGVLEQVLAGLHQIAGADAPLNPREEMFLAAVARNFGLDEASAARAGRGGFGASTDVDPYGVLGIARGATGEEIRARWKTLMRENHPDSLASKGVPPDMIAAASDRVAKINAAYDVIKRERKL